MRRPIFHSRALPDGVRLPAQYERLLRLSTTLHFDMNSDVLTGSLLRTLAASKPGGAILELGTGCGLGTSWLLDGMDSAATLVSVDTDDRVQSVARAELGADPRLTLRLQDGAVFLRECQRQFDLIYADAWPGKFSYLDAALDRLAPGGLYLVDDLLPQPNWPADHDRNVEGLLDYLAARRDCAVTSFDWSTGLILLVRR